MFVQESNRRTRVGVVNSAAHGIEQLQHVGCLHEKQCLLRWCSPKAWWRVCEEVEQDGLCFQRGPFLLIGWKPEGPWWGRVKAWMWGIAGETRGVLIPDRQDSSRGKYCQSMECRRRTRWKKPRINGRKMIGR